MNRSTIMLQTALVLVLAAPSFAESADNAADRAQVKQAVAQFYASLNTLFTGDVSSMEKMWSHADDVTYMGPAGGFQVGWDQVRSNWKKQAALKLGGKVEPRDLQMTVGDDLALVACYEIGNNVDAQGRPLRVSIRATSQFRKENGTWKMIGHHTDLLPYLAKQPPRKKSAGGER